MYWEVPWEAADQPCIDLAWQPMLPCTLSVAFAHWKFNYDQGVGAPYGQEACFIPPYSVFACGAPSSHPSLTLRGPSMQAGPVVDAGGLFEYARQTGMIKAA